MAIKRAKLKEKTDTLADGNGLALLAETNGSKGWRYRYQFAGKTKMISLGIYPVVTLNEARAKRDEARKQVANGINPSEARKAEKAGAINQTETYFKTCLSLSIPYLKLKPCHLLSKSQCNPFLFSLTKSENFGAGGVIYFVESMHIDSVVA
ncbi:MAG: hypothetical protein MEPRV_01243 [Providencia sp.]